MRILLFVPGPLDGQPAGAMAVRCGLALEAGGHHVRVLAVDDDEPAISPLPVRHVVCHPRAVPPGLPLVWPALDQHPRAANRYERLSDAQLLAYHDALRNALDLEIDGFNPHLVHAHYLSLPAHLALEAGVPYVVSVYGPDLELAASDRRLHSATQEAAENAGHLLLHAPPLLGAIERQFGELDRGRTLFNAAASTDVELAKQLAAIYEGVLLNRYGAIPD
jgi:predicted nucleic acid-binding protein